MNPHSESQIRILELVLYELGRHIRPRPDWHSPTISNTCWLWTGDMTMNRDTEGNLYKKTVWSSGGRTKQYANRAQYPILRIGAHTAISVHRLLFMLYRRPSLPVTMLTRSRPCPPNCVNPFHWEAHTSDQRTRDPKKYPETSLLNGVFEFLDGRMAQDEQTMLKRAEIEERAIDRHMEELKSTHAILTLEEYFDLKNRKEAKTPSGEMFEIHEFARTHWLVDRMTGQERIGGDEEYNAVAHWRAVFKVQELSPELEELLRWYSVPLPKYHESSDDYWIGRENLESGESLCYDAMREGREVGYAIASKDKRVHVRLMLLTMGRQRPGLVETIDWSK